MAVYDAEGTAVEVRLCMCACVFRRVYICCTRPIPYTMHGPTNLYPTPTQPRRVAAAEAAFNALLAQIAAEAEASQANGSSNGSNGNGQGAQEEEEDVGRALHRLLQRDPTAASALPPPLLGWVVHRFEGWVGGSLPGIGAGEVRGVVVCGMCLCGTD